MLERVWIEGNLYTLLVGMQTGAATLENSMEIPQKLKIELPYDPALPLLGIYPNNLKSTIQSNICTPTFIAVLFTIAKTWKLSKCPSTDDWMKKMWYIYIHNGILPSHKKRQIHLICNNMEGPGGNYAKRNKPD
uniref:Uncharacterized protein n=1 Tax=Equus caballus TaxID=9796 RepID=A0A9L0SVL8_HORSE